MVRHDRWGVVAPVDRVDLSYVLEYRHELDALASAGGCERRQILQGRDVGALVEDEKERRVERLSRFGRMAIHVRDDLLDERREERPEAALLVGGCAEVCGMRAAVEQSVGAEIG